MPISFDDVEMATPSAEVAASWADSQVGRARAVRAVASASVDAADCEQLLDVLGLRAGEGVVQPPRPRGRGSTA